MFNPTLDGHLALFSKALDLAVLLIALWMVIIYFERPWDESVIGAICINSADTLKALDSHASGLMVINCSEKDAYISKANRLVVNSTGLWK